MHRYWAFGLNIESDLALPELLPSQANPDVRIRLGATPEALCDAESRGTHFQASPGRFLLRADGTGKFLVSRGEEILVDLAPGGDEDVARAYVLGSAFGALLHQRGLLPLHGSAIRAGDGCVAFIGSAGSGKSTLAAAFAERGYGILSDDICVASVEDGFPALVQPAVPYVSLCDDAARSLGLDPSAFPTARGQEGKRRIPLESRFCQTPLPLVRAYFLSPTDVPEVRLEPIPGAERIFVFLSHTYRRAFLAGKREKRGHFLKCGRLGREVAVKRVIRPAARWSLNDVAERVEKDLTSA